MTDKPHKDDATKRGDAILKRMLQSKPKPHKDMIKERRKPGPTRRRGTREAAKASRE